MKNTATTKKINGKIRFNISYHYNDIMAYYNHLKDVIYAMDNPEADVLLYGEVIDIDRYNRCYNMMKYLEPIVRMFDYGITVMSLDYNQIQVIYKIYKWYNKKNEH